MKNKNFPLETNLWCNGGSLQSCLQSSWVIRLHSYVSMPTMVTVQCAVISNLEKDF